MSHTLLTLLLLVVNKNRDSAGGEESEQWLLRERERELRKRRLSYSVLYSSGRSVRRCTATAEEVAISLASTSPVDPRGSKSKGKKKKKKWLADRSEFLVGQTTTK